MALLSLALLSLFTLTSYVPHGPPWPILLVMSPMALLSLFTLTSYVPHGPTVLYCPLALLSLCHPN